MSKVAVLVTTVVLVGTTGCLGLEFIPFEDPEADEVRDKAATAWSPRGYGDTA